MEKIEEEVFLARVPWEKNIFVNMVWTNIFGNLDHEILWPRIQTIEENYNILMDTIHPLERIQ